MNPNFRWPVPEDESDRQVISDVKEFGWHAVGVNEEAEIPDSASTCGGYGGGRTGAGTTAGS